MKKNSFLWAALSMTAALVMTACTSEDNTVDTPAAPQAEVKTIPYSVTVGQGGDATTRATVADDPSDATNYHKTLYFAAGDQLYISSDSRTDLKGTLTLKAGDEGKSNGATFEGSITYTGDAPEGTTEIKATLVGSSNVGVQITDGKVTGVSYPSDAYCNDVAEAVQKYSNLTGTSTYGAKSFSLTQQTAFLNFEITFADGTTTGTNLSAVVSNGGSALCTANVTTVTDNGVKAKFVLPVAKGTTLSSANVKFDDRVAISFGASQMLDGKVYNVKRITVTWNSTNVFNDSHQGVVLNKTNTTPLTYEDITISFTGTGGGSGFRPYDNQGKATLNRTGDDSFTFTALTGKKFTKIEIIDNSFILFTEYGGWTQPEDTKILWSGTAANTVTLVSSGMTFANDLNSIVFTLVDE